jgi:hypothetical protein
MSIFIPSIVDKRKCGSVFYNLSGTQYGVFIPISGRHEDPPSSFFQRRNGEGNDVCHVKMTTARLRYDKNTQILSDPTINHHLYSHTRRVMAATYSAHHAVYIDLEYATDTSGQILYGSRWTAVIYHYREIVKNGWYHQEHGDHQFRVMVDYSNKQRQVKSGTSYPQDNNSVSGAARALGNWLANDYRLPGYMYNRCPEDSVLQRICQDILDEYVGSIWYQFDLSQIDGYPSSSSRYEQIAHEVEYQPPSDSLWDKLILDEYNLVFGTGYSTEPFAAYHFKRLRQGAYLDCLDNVPILNENSISNIIGIVALIKSIVIDKKVEIPKSLSSAWLAYRYQYGTSKSDLEEAIDFQHRMVDSTFLDRGFDCYGVFCDMVKDIPVTCRCHITMKQKELDWLSKISTELYRYGLSPSFYVFWDTVPYSFIIDWFIPIGDILSGYDKTRMYDRTYEMTDIWFSYKYNLADDQGGYSAYTRYGSSALPEFQGYYTFDNKGTTSDITIGKRVLDSLSLIFR